MVLRSADIYQAYGLPISLLPNTDYIDDSMLSSYANYQFNTKQYVGYCRYHSSIDNYKPKLRTHEMHEMIQGRARTYQVRGELYSGLKYQWINQTFSIRCVGQVARCI